MCHMLNQLKVLVASYSGIDESQTKLGPMCRPRKDGRLGEPENVRFYQKSSSVVPDCEATELVTMLAPGISN